MLTVVLLFHFKAAPSVTKELKQEFSNYSFFHLVVQDFFSSCVSGLAHQKPPILSVLQHERAVLQSLSLLMITCIS